MKKIKKKHEKNRFYKIASTKTISTKKSPKARKKNTKKKLLIDFLSFGNYHQVSKTKLRKIPNHLTF